MLIEQLGVSERRACRVAGQERSTHRHELKRVPDAALRAELRRIPREEPRSGYRRAQAHLVAEGWSVMARTPRPR